MGGIRKRKGIIVLVSGSWVYYFSCIFPFEFYTCTLFVPLSSHQHQSKQEITTLIQVIIILLLLVVVVLVLFFLVLSIASVAAVLIVFYYRYSPNLHRTSLSNSSFFCCVPIINRLSRERNNWAFHSLLFSRFVHIFFICF